MLGLNAAVENHIRKHQKKPTFAIPSCSTLWPRINVCSAGRSGDPSHPRKEREPQATNVADRAAADRAPGPGMAARRLSRFHLEIGEGDAATGKGDTVLLRRRSFSNSGFSESVPVKLTSHSAQLPVRQA